MVTVPFHRRCLMRGTLLSIIRRAGRFPYATLCRSKVLWSFQWGSGHHASPVTYMLDGRQYLAVCVGWGGWTAGFAGDEAPWLKNARRGNTVFVFALPKDN